MIMAIVMNMSSYEIEHDVSDGAEYADEIACSGWNPALTLACQQPAVPEKHAAMPTELAHIDVDQFLQKMYVLMR
jgi:hypothetical protein